MSTPVGSLDRLSPVKRAILELREMRSRLDEVERSKTEPIAIIGIGCRFPGGATDPETFWRLLRDGVDAITEVPADRWDMEAYYDPDPDAPGKMSTRWGGFLQEIDQFDPDFFGISPREAASMDPQQRLLLEVSWEALENAGQAPDKLFGSAAGAFVGIGSFDYSQLQMQSGDPNHIDAYFATGSCHSVASGRLSYVLGLQGPSLSIDTACSSSLVAVHLACQSLRGGECTLALAGGVNLILAPEILINFSKSHMMAADGRCKTFDAAADGFVRAEGCGLVVLKRLSAALADGDRILALIRGSAVNQDGRSNSLTAPNGPAQQAVVRQALVNAGVEAAQVHYVEAHGTGTALGDPIEVQALAAVLGEGRSPAAPLALGSVKTNLGHLEAAAGVAGLIKVVLALQRAEIPPHLHIHELNPHIAWAELPVVVPTTCTPWPAGSGRRVSGVSSFGFSGTNAHVVVEEAPISPPVPGGMDRPRHLLALSAKSESALQALAGRYAQHLAAHPAVALADVCFTAHVGRSHFTHRLAVVAESVAQVRDTLAAYAAGQAPAGVLKGQVAGTERPEVVFLFTGQGAQYVGMGRQLYDSQPTFRQALERCDALLRPYLEQPLLAVLYPKPGAPSPLDETAYTQPALFALEYALAELWRSWGVEPAALLGHSVGEYVAACVAGVFSLEDGLKLVAERGQLMQAVPQVGMMAAVFAEEARVAATLAPYAEAVTIAAVNGPQHVVLSGAAQAVREVLAQLEAEGITTRPLRVSQAFHSPLMEPMLDGFERVARQVQYATPRLALLSNLTGQLFESGQMPQADYWRRHAREVVRFAAGIETLWQRGHRVFIELGPRPTLVGLGRQCVGAGAGVWLPSLRPGRDEWQQLLESVGTLYAHGVALDWEGFDRNYPRRKVLLPTYPFQRQRYWLEEVQERQRRQSTEQSHLWESVVAAGHQQAQQVPMDLGLHTYPEKWQCLERITTAYMVRTLRDLGAYTHRDEGHSPDTLLHRFNISPTYRSLLSRWLKKLATEGILQQHEGIFVSPHPLPTPSLDLLWREAREVLADIPSLADYIERCGRLLAAILTGQESPLASLFPGGSFATAEDLYHNWALPRYFNGIVRATVASVVQALPPDRELRILEVGAGTGGTTASLLPVLPAGRTTYCYTDVSDVFLSLAEQRFKAYPFVRYGVLDIERKPQEQSYGAHDFDIVVAANVLHATRNLGETLGHVRSLLGPGGLLLLYETTSHPAWFDISIGLIEGWQRFDDEWRQDNPLLSEKHWEEALRSHGFEEVTAFPESGSAAEVLAQHIILARAPSSDGFRESHVPALLQAHLEHEVSHADRDTQAKTEEKHAEEFWRQLKEALPNERLEFVVHYVRARVSEVLRRDPSQPLDRRHRLMDLGIDSLMAVELRSLLGAGLGLKHTLPATLVFDYPTVEAIAEYLVREVLAFDQPAIVSHLESDHDSAAMTPAAMRLAELSEDEVEKLLIKKLETL